MCVCLYGFVCVGASHHCELFLYMEKAKAEKRRKLEMK